MRSPQLLALLVMIGCATPEAPVRDPVPVRPLNECGDVDPGEFGPLEVAIVIDTSMFSADASGADVNLNGKVGKSRDLFFEPPRLGSTDPADSFRGAQVIAANSLVTALEDTPTRFSVVSYSAFSQDDSPLSANARRETARADKRLRIPRPNPRGYVEVVHPNRRVDAAIETPVTANDARVRIALAQVFDMKLGGGLKFSSAMQLAVQSLQTDLDPVDAPPRVALLMATKPTANLFDPNGSIDPFDPAMKTVAQIAIDSGVAFNTFGLGDAATTPPPTAVSRIAGATGGTYHAVTDAAQLYCELLRSLVPYAQMSRSKPL